MLYDELQIKLLRLLQRKWDSVISFDMETVVLNPDQFLTNERILSICLARRVSGDFLDEHGIEIKTLILHQDDDNSEIELLKDLDATLSEIRPLGVIGYGLRQYDIPLLAIKKQHYKLRLWKLIDMVESAVHIDLYHLLKYKGYKKLDQVILSPEFAHLPLKRTKNIVAKDRKKKGKEILRLWRENRTRLKEYVEGDVYDTLLIAEKFAFEEIRSLR